MLLVGYWPSANGVYILYIMTRCTVRACSCVDRLTLALDLLTNSATMVSDEASGSEMIDINPDIACRHNLRIIDLFCEHDGTNLSSEA